MKNLRPLAVFSAALMGLLAFAVSGTAGASTTGRAPPVPGQHSRAHGVVSAPQTLRALVAAYALFRDIPAGDVSVVRPGTVRTAYDRSTKTYWATASFLPSTRASTAVLLGFQDGGSTGLFSRHGSAQWRMIGYGSQPVSCSSSLPAAVRRSWHASTSECDRISGDRTRSGPLARPDISSAADPLTIAVVAEQNVGVGDTPASTSFSFDCDPFTTLVGVGASTSGCGVDPRFKVQNENEQWCSDFSKYVWEQGGVTADLSTLDPASASFYQWALDQGQHPSFDSGTPQVGDAIVFYPSSDKAPNATFADHVGLVVGVNSNGTLNLVNGDFSGSTNITVQQNDNISVGSWAASIYGSGEHWIYVSPGVVGEVVLRANTGHLFTYDPSTNGHVDANLGMAAGTSPAIAAGSGGFEVALQANTGHLFIYNPQTSGHVDAGLGMAAGTSPAIAAAPGGGFEVAFQANTGHLFIYNPQTNSHVDTGLGMAAGTSPSIAGSEVAFQANTGHLLTYDPATNGHVDAGLGMAAGTSPSIAGSGVAFQANTGHLFIYDPSTNGHVDAGLGMAAGTSPSIAGSGVAFQANTGHLFIYDPSTNGHVDAGLGMAAGTSPSIAGSEVAFQANTGHLFTYDPATNGHVDAGLGMTAGTSPSMSN